MLRPLIIIAFSLVALEIIAYVLIKRLRLKFQWLITPKDEKPELDREGLKKFIAHGYDPELGWIRKPNTWHPERGKRGETAYHIDAIGSRCNPGHEHLKPLISFYGDSFSFCRQVNDNETYQWYLSEIANAGVLNFCVGNYGLDQAYLRMARQIDKTKTDIVILGVVPSTIVRLLCVWKHYNEFGNTFAFKPRFDIKDGKLILIKNIIDDKSKFYEYEKYIKGLQGNDYFYTTKFRKEMIGFPYIYHTLKNPGRNVPIITALVLRGLLQNLGIENNRLKQYPMMKIMHINKVLRYKLFQNKYATDIFCGIIDKFVELSKQKNFKPVFLFTPQKDDVLFIKRKGPYYAHVIERIKKKLFTIDMTEPLVGVDNLDILYSEDNIYGGHFSKEGNRFGAKAIYHRLKENKMLSNKEKVCPITK